MQIGQDKYGNSVSVTLQWQRRLYDTRGNAHPNARRCHNFQKVLLDMQRHCATVDVADWKKLLTHIAGQNTKALCSTVKVIADKARQSHQFCRDHLEVKLLTMHAHLNNYCILSLVL